MTANQLMRPVSILPRNLSPKHAGLEPKAADTFVQNGPEEHSAPGATDHTPRVEPRLDASASSKPTYEELRQLVALYDRQPDLRRKRMVRVGIIGLIFVVGTTVGIGAASWLRAQQGPVMRNLSVDMHTLPIHQNGTSDGELPYDGRVADRGGRQVQEAARSLNPAELPYGGESRLDAGVAQAERSAPASLPAEVPHEPAPQATAGTTEAPLPAASQEKQVKQSVSSAERKVVPAQVHRQKSLRRAAKDKEIQRIRQQAEEELKKKPESARRGSEVRAAAARAAQQKGSRSKNASHGSRAATMTAMLQQCEQAGNIISREYCKWQLCSGKWGKSGCPSYPPHGSIN